MNGPESLDMMSSRIDTNILLRFLVGDGGEHALRAKDLLLRVTSGAEQIILCDIIFIETVFVLQSYYKKDRTDIAKALKSLVRLPGIQTETASNVLVQALELYSLHHIDWADAILAAKSLDSGTSIYSFDRDFAKIPGIVVKQP